MLAGNNFKIRVGASSQISATLEFKSQVFFKSGLKILWTRLFLAHFESDTMKVFKS